MLRTTVLGCLCAAVAAVHKHYVSRADRAAGDEIVLWPQGPPGELPGWIGPEVHIPRTYKPGNYKGIEVRNVTRPTLAPYLVNGSLGAVIVAPGGSYEKLAYTKEGTAVAERLNAMGVSAFVLKYRVPLRPAAASMPYAWAQLQDAQRAVGLVRGRAAEWGVDPGRVAFMGFSAGGHLAAHLSTAWQRRIYPATDAYDDVSCRPDASLLIYPWHLLARDDPREEQLAPEFNVSASTPPSFIVGSSADKMADPQSWLQYFKKLRDFGVASALHVYQDGGHGFALCAASVEADYCDWPLEAERFLQKVGVVSSSSKGGAKS